MQKQKVDYAWELFQVIPISRECSAEYVRSDVEKIIQRIKKEAFARGKKAGIKSANSISINQ